MRVIVSFYRLSLGLNRLLIPSPIRLKEITESIIKSPGKKTTHQWVKNCALD
tara:strand:- start:26 stop:181 length:156 start_codon:yes stop_codon:yes gene_type:complete